MAWIVRRLPPTTSLASAGGSWIAPTTSTRPPGRRVLEFWAPWAWEYWLGLGWFRCSSLFWDVLGIVSSRICYLSGLGGNARFFCLGRWLGWWFWAVPGLPVSERRPEGKSKSRFRYAWDLFKRKLLGIELLRPKVRTTQLDLKVYTVYWAGPYLKSRGPLH